MITDVTVKFLAAEMLTSIDYLVQQFAEAGINKSKSDTVTQQEKEALLAYLNRKHGNMPNKLTLQRKTRSTLSIAKGGGKSKSVKIEIRKKQTYINRNTQATLKIEEEAQSEPNTDTKLRIKEKEKFKALKITQDNAEEKQKTLNQHTNKKTKEAQIEKARRMAEATELKRKAEEEVARRIEEKARIVAAEARQMAKENSEKWAEDEEVRAAVETADYHITTSQYARVAEDENDAKVESECRSRTRSSKTGKQKKISKLAGSKTDREEARSAIRGRKHKRKLSGLQQGFNKPDQVVSREIIIGETITVIDLANKMAVKGSQVIAALIKLGTMVTINQTIDQNTAQLVAEEMGHKVTLLRENKLEEALMNDRDTGDSAEPRAPVVTIMGHVDHGKTSLLDYIRATKIAAGEVGGITQHIGAYRVQTDNGMITFLDTPGHAAFTAMRSRGAQATDIVVLVVAADDGVKPQTIEAIQHAQAAKVPLVVAVNKIDKQEADTDKIRQALSKHGVIPEEWGGDVQFVHVSAKVGTGINELLNAILLQAEILELKAVRGGMASGVVIESFLDKGRGPVASVLVQSGTLNRGDTVLCGFEYGRVRAMRDEQGHEVTSAGPSIPVEILGLSNVPLAGSQATVVRDEKKAREVALHRQSKFREGRLAKQQKYNLENMFSNISDGAISELNIVLKTDVQGSCEAIIDSLLNLSTEEVKLKIIGSGVGRITETDAALAAASGAIILGFNVRADASARRVIIEENLDLRYYSVIYSLIDQVKKAMGGMLEPEYKHKIIGLAEARDIFKSQKFGSIAGCMVTEGMIKRSHPIRILRDNVVIYEGELESLRRFKEDVNEVRNGMECGIGIKNYHDIRIGDMIEVFEIIEIQRTM